jgi:hypothetical protein
VELIGLLVVAVVVQGVITLVQDNLKMVDMVLVDHQ